MSLSINGHVSIVVGIATVFVRVDISVIPITYCDCRATIAFSGTLPLSLSSILLKPDYKQFSIFLNIVILDKTYMCNTEKPKCPKGLDIVEMQNSQGTWCYYVCQSRCKASAGYCGEGTCYQEPDSDEILCRLVGFLQL